jgi:hypothetical protein
MNKLKEKLTANMRTVQRTGSPAADGVVGSERAAPVEASPAARPRQAARRPRASAAATGFETPPDSTALFPSRVWPD